MDESYSDIKQHIRSIADWPRKGIVFRDISPLLADRLMHRRVIDAFVYRYLATTIDAVVAIDARGFIIGSPLAYLLNTPFIPVRKRHKLPGDTIIQAYSLEYGEAELEMQTGALLRGDRVLLVDDLIATGGTMLAAAQLIDRLGAEVVEAAAIIDLPEVGGSAKLRTAGLAVHALCTFADNE